MAKLMQITDRCRKGDIILIQQGVEVYTKVPERCFYSNSQNSTEMIDHEVRVGEVYPPIPYDLSTEFRTIKKEILHLLGDCPIDETDLRTFLNRQLRRHSKKVRKGFDASQLVGRYRVVSGGMGRVSRVMFNDIYPAAWEVKAIKLDQPMKGATIRFNQKTNCRGATIDSVPLIRAGAERKALVE